MDIANLDSIIDNAVGITNTNAETSNLIGGVVVTEDPLTGGLNVDDLDAHAGLMTLTSMVNESVGTPEAPPETAVDSEVSEDSTTVENDRPNANRHLQENNLDIGQNEGLARFSDAPWFDVARREVILLAGLGGIGSWTALNLARLAPQHMVLMDDDVVEPVNRAGQLFGTHDHNTSKVGAIARTITSYCKYNHMTTIVERFTEETHSQNIMICGFDNMGARKTFFNVWRSGVQELPEQERAKCLFIDGRLSAEYLQVICMRGDDQYSIDKYLSEFLFSDDEADSDVCSYKQTSYMANMIGSIITNLFVNFCTSRTKNTFSRPMPFLTEYDATTMYFKTTD